MATTNLGFWIFLFPALHGIEGVFFLFLNDNFQAHLVVLLPMILQLLSFLLVPFG